MEKVGNVLDTEGLVAESEAAGQDPLGLMGRRDFSILVVDDSPAMRQEVLKALERLPVFSAVREAENGIEAFKKVSEEIPDLVLCDMVMPIMDGMRFLALLYSRPEFREVPVIFLTGQTDVETKIKGLEMGASDYVTKPFDAGELLARIKVQLKIKSLQDKLKSANRQLWELSTVDALTRVYNRRYFMHRLDTEFKRGGRYDSLLSFIMIDIDHFKKLNDTYGHQVGDDVLRTLGPLIGDTVRESDVAGRYGGEEFCVLLPHTDLEGAKSLAIRLHESVRDTEIDTSAGPLKITVSMGVSSTALPGVGSTEDLIRLADEALYRSKREGRDRVTCAEGAGSETG